uniref:Uncharacterized protein n=1 Tax=Physcomitrium patens TaxID=3218 RepID=A0A2K1JIW5_PHYPA|nr:hypothetical protein PHYPA_018891 [Physcomitrium patens]
MATSASTAATTLAVAAPSSVAWFLPAKEAPKGFTPPTLNADTLTLIFGGSTDGLLRKA